MTNTQVVYEVKLHTISSRNTEIERNSAELTQHSQEKLRITAHCFHSNLEIHSKGGLRVLPRAYLVYKGDYKHIMTHNRKSLCLFCNLIMGAD